MRRDPVSGTLLILGAIGLLVVAGTHPTGHEIASADDVAHMVRLNAIVHGTAIGAIAILFAGALGLSRAMGDDAWSRLALSFFALSGLAAMSAAVISGFVAPEILGRLRSGGEEATLEQLGWYSWRINQGYARVHIAASAGAILLWSIPLVRRRGGPRVAGALGILVGATVLLPLFAGALTLDVHGFGAVMLAESAWLIWMGILLLRRRDSAMRLETEAAAA